VRVYSGGALKKIFPTGKVSIGGEDHAGMEKEMCILCPFRERFLYLSGSLAALPVAVQRPGKSIMDEYAVSDLQIFASPSQCFGGIFRRIAVKTGKMMKVTPVLFGGF